MRKELTGPGEGMFFVQVRAIGRSLCRQPVEGWRNPESLFIYFIYLFLAVLGLCCGTWAFSSCGEQGLHFLAVHRLLIAVASLVVGHGL